MYFFYFDHSRNFFNYFDLTNKKNYFDLTNKKNFFFDSKSENLTVLNELPRHSYILQLYVYLVYFFHRVRYVRTFSKRFTNSAASKHKLRFLQLTTLIHFQ